jgi:hypothetical protein
MLVVRSLLTAKLGQARALETRMKAVAAARHVSPGLGPRAK